MNKEIATIKRCHYCGSKTIAGEAISEEGKTYSFAECTECEARATMRSDQKYIVWTNVKALREQSEITTAALMAGQPVPHTNRDYLYEEKITD